MKYSPKHLYAAVFVLICIFLCFRIPFYQQRLVGEEGIFAHLFLSEVQKPNYLLISRVDGINQMGVPQHPAPMYVAINVLGKATRSFLDFTRLDELRSASLLRLIFSLPLLFLFVSALIYVHKKRNTNLYYWLALFLCFISSPVVLVTSTELQVDASFGITIFGIWVLAILALTSRPGTCRAKGGLLLLGSFIASLGKNEWSLVLFLSMLLVTAYVALRRREIPSAGEQLTVLSFGFAGIMLGNLASYLYDPLNYALGFELMSSMSKQESIFNDSKWLRLMGTMKVRSGYVAQNILLLMTCSFIFLKSVLRAPVMERAVTIILPLAGLYFLSLWSAYLLVDVLTFLVPLAVLVFMVRSASALVPGSVPLDPLTLLPVVFSGLLFLAYFISTWEVGPRYFSLALTMSLFALLGVMGHCSATVERKLVVNLTLCILVLNCVSYLNLDSYQRVVERLPKSAQQRGTDCLPVMSSGQAVFGSMDFLGGACSKEYFEEMSKKHNRPLCVD